MPEEICSVFQIEKTKMNLQMQLLTMEIAERLPKNDDIVNLEDAVAQCHFFMPGTGFDWYVLSGDPVENGEWFFVGWGAWDDDGGEYGHTSTWELERMQGPCGLGVERDLYFTPKPISEIIAARGK